MSVSGIDKLNQNIDKLLARYGEDVKTALLMSAELVRGDAVRSIQTQTAGKTVTRYRQGGGSYQHVVSAPNTAPNTDTGALVRSIVTEVQGEDVYVGSGLHYAPHLEFGTSKMIQRPFLNPALEKNRKRINRLITDAMKKTTDKGVK
jgi:HK97 gp10 family phage protein